MRIETSSIEVGSSARTTFGSTASARAIATRWRWPPESSCGYLAAICSAGTRPTVSQQLVDALSTCAARHDAVDPQRPREVVAHVLTGFSESNGSWKIICTCER